MKPWTYYAAGFAVATAMTLASCGEDDEPLPVENRPPTVEVTGAAASGRIEGLTEATANAVTVEVDDPDGNLNAITFFRNGTQVTPGSNNVRTDATTPILNNPSLIVDEKDGFTRDYFFVTAVEAGDSVEYTILVTDEEQLTDTTSFVLVNAAPLTRISRTLEGILLNQAGPEGTGGLDLDTGEGTASTDPEAEIRDRGIDQNQPAATNWVQRIAPVDSAILHRVSETYLSEQGITFADVEFVEQIQAAFESTSVDALESDVLNGGEVFSVLDDSTYYMIQIDSVIVAPEDNTDRYIIDIKY